MGLFGFLKSKNKTSTSAQDNTYSLERKRILDILRSQLANAGDSRSAIPMRFFIKQTEEFNSDYAMIYDRGCCEKCAPYRKRYYSISGKDSRLPKLPDFFLDIKNWEHCGLALSPTTQIAVDVEFQTNSHGILNSKRPFMDDRTVEEKLRYQAWLDEKQAEADKAQDKKDYEYLQAHHPEIIPKSFGAYRRLKNSNPDKFNEIKQYLNT